MIRISGAVPLIVGAALAAGGVSWGANAAPAAAQAPHAEGKTVVATGTTATAAATPAALASEAEQGKALVQTLCSNCHDVGVVRGPRKTLDEWNETINRMIGHGAPLTEEQADQIVNYLAKFQGPNSP